MDLKIYSEDMNPQEKAELHEFKKSGCPGILKISETQIKQWFELYMSGKTYEEIAKYTRYKKKFILYISNKFKWYDKRLNYYQNISGHLLNKIHDTKVKSADTITGIINSLSKYFDQKINKYLTTNDPTIMENLNNKALFAYYRSIEVLDKIIENTKPRANKDGKSPSVNININGGKVDEKIIEIEEGEEDEGAVEEKAMSNAQILRALANYTKSSK